MPFTEAQRRSKDKWDREHMKIRGIVYPKGTIDRIKAAAEKKGKSVNGFCVQAIMAAVEAVDKQGGRDNG